MRKPYLTIGRKKLAGNMESVTVIPMTPADPFVRILT